MNIELLLLAFAGVLLHYLFRWKELVEKQLMPDLKLSSEVPGFLISVITTIILVYVREDIKDLYPITPFSAVVLGYFSQSLFNNFVTSRMPGSKSKPHEE